MRCSRQSGHGASFMTYWKKYAPRIAAMPTAATTSAAPAAGSERSAAGEAVDMSTDPERAAPTPRIRIAPAAAAVDPSAVDPSAEWGGKEPPCFDPPHPEGARLRQGFGGPPHLSPATRPR